MTPRSRTVLAGAVALAIVAAGCSRSPSAADAGAQVETTQELRADVASPSAPAASAKVMAPEPAGVDGPGVEPGAMGSAAMTQDVGTRRFVRTAQVEFSVADVQRSMQRIEDLVARFDGFVTRSDARADIGRVERRSLGDGRLVELSTYSLRGELQVRVPSDRAQAFLRAIAAEMEFLDRRHYEAVDAQFELLRRELARLRHDAAQAALGSAAQGGRTGERVEAIDRRADQQAARDEARIEQKVYEDRVAYATLDLSMRQPERVRRAERPDVDAILQRERPGLGTRIVQALADGGRGALDVAVSALVLWPLALAALIAALLLRAWRRRG